MSLYTSAAPILANRDRDLRVPRVHPIPVTSAERYRTLWGGLLNRGCVTARAGLLVVAVFASGVAAGSGPGAMKHPAGAFDEGLRFEVHVLTIADDGHPIPHEPDAGAAYRPNPNRWAVTRLPVPIWLNPSGAPVRLDVDTIVANAARQWSDIPGSTFAYEYRGTTTAGAGACKFGSRELDGRNTVVFTDELAPGTLGITCSAWSGGTSGNLVEFDIQLNSSVRWGASNNLGPEEYDLASTVLHELGHGLGLGHPCSAGWSCTVDERQSVMFPSLKPREQRNVLGADDRAGVIELYPGSGEALTGTRLFIPVIGRD
ncbi:MAG: hypothetical protein KatS3mg082_3225 [Nitrospiraceae bacterium]|nr:MAG: hypothetical protein KatS3mg082_3225 [Nitrospiraceae bacterium]